MADGEVPQSLFDDKSEEIAKYLQKRVKESNSPVTDPAQFGEYMTNPSQAVGSKYHQYIPKEIALGNLSDEDNRIVYVWSKVIDRAIYMADKKLVTADLPNDISALFIAWLNGTRGKGMQHEKLMVEQNIRIHKTEETRSNNPSLFGKFAKK